MSKDPRVEELNDVHQVMETEYGRRMMYRLLSESGIYRSSFSPGQPDNQTFFNEGKRNIGLFWLSEIQEICPKLYLKMIGEQDEQ